MKMNTTTTTDHQIILAKAQMAASILQGLIAYKSPAEFTRHDKPEAGADHFDFEVRVAVILAEKIYKATPA